MKKRIVVLGATGSIGESAMRVARELSDKMEVLGLSGKNNVDRLLQLAREFPEALLCAGDVPSAEDLSRKLGRPVLHGAEGLESLAELPDADLVMVAIVGTSTTAKYPLSAMVKMSNLPIVESCLQNAGRAVRIPTGATTLRMPNSR